jgi:uncharacterized membrane protein
MPMPDDVPSGEGDQHYGDAGGTLDRGPQRVWNRGSAEFDRVIFLTDGVFAIAITILVLDLQVPDVSDPGQLASAVRDEWPSFFAFFLTFAIIAVTWMGHHSFVSMLERLDATFVRWNFLNLVCVCLMPYTSSLISQHADDSTFAVAVYLGLIAVLALVDLLGDVVAARRKLIAEPGYPPWLRRQMIEASARAAVVTVGIVIALISARPSDGLLWLLVLIPVNMVISGRDPGRTN